MKTRTLLLPLLQALACSRAPVLEVSEKEGAPREAAPSDAAHPVPDDGPQPKPKVTVHFELEARDQGARAVIIAVEPLGLRREMGLVQPDHRCALVKGEDLRTGFMNPELRLGCMTHELSVRIVELPNGLSVHRTVDGQRRPGQGDDETIPLIEGTEVELRSELVDPGAITEACVGAAVPMVVESSVVGTGQDRSLRIRVPAKGCEERLAWSEQTYCRSRQGDQAEGYFVGCGGAESGVGIRFVVRDGALFVTRSEWQLGGGPDNPLGGYAVPACTRLVPSRVRLIGAKWTPLGGCPSCTIAEDDCEDRCPLQPETARMGCEEQCIKTSIRCVGECQTAPPSK